VAFWTLKEGVIITIFYIAAAVVIYKSVVLKIMDGIEDGSIEGDITITFNTLIAIASTAFLVGLSKKSHSIKLDHKNPE